MHKIEVDTVWTSLLPKLWNSLPRDSVKGKRDTITYVRCGTKAAAVYILDKMPDCGIYEINQKLTKKHKDSQWYSSTYCYERDSYWNQGTKEAMVLKLKSALKKEYYKLYQELNIEERVNNKKLTLAEREKKALEAKAEIFTIPTQKEVTRELAFELLKQAVSQSGVPIKLECDDVYSEYGAVYVRVVPFNEDSYADKAFSGRLSTENAGPWGSNEKVDRSGQKLYNELLQSGIPSERIAEILLKSEDPDCRRFAVKFGSSAAIGLLDSDTKVRSVAKRRAGRNKIGAAADDDKAKTD